MALVGTNVDFPVFRLADVYLMAAEAILRSGGDTSTALNLVNQVRARAFGDDSHGINSAQLNLQYILNERGRELYWECVRRTDLIRYGQFTGGSYIWQWKGGVLDGRSTNSKYNVCVKPSEHESLLSMPWRANGGEASGTTWGNDGVTGTPSPFLRILSHAELAEHAEADANRLDFVPV